MSGAGSLARRASRPRERRCENTWHLAAPSHDVGTQSRGQCDSIPATLLPSMLLEVGHRADLVCICVSVCGMPMRLSVHRRQPSILSLLMRFSVRGTRGVCTRPRPCARVIRAGMRGCTQSSPWPQCLCMHAPVPCLHASSGRVYTTIDSNANEKLTKKVRMSMLRL